MTVNSGKQGSGRRGYRWCLLVLVCALTVSARADEASDWPNRYARYMIDIFKTSGAEMTDPSWLHLHLGHGDAEQAGIGVAIIDDVVPEPLTGFADMQIRYMVHGVPVSGWLSPPFDFTLDVSNPALDTLQDGIHDVSVDVQGARRNDFRPAPIFLHLFRGRQASTLVPIIDRDCMYCRYDDTLLKRYGPGVVYVDPSQRQERGYPVDPAVTPWTGAPYQADLFQEEMAPHGDLFASAQMWWEEPPGTVNAGLKFARAIDTKTGELHPDLWTHPAFRGDNDSFGFAGQKNFPFKDGPRGVGWTSPYVTGAVDSLGGFAFVEAGGPLRYMKPNGEVITVAGWRVKPGKDPVWFLKPLNVIRQNMELRGVWLNGQYTVDADRGFHGPFDVTIDARNENIWYVAGFHDNTIWKVVVDRSTYIGTVSVLAGDPGHQAGFADGVGHAARLHGPMSLVFDPITNSIYVADQLNDAIRRLNPDTGELTTLFGSPGQGARLASRGLPVWNGLEGCTPDPAPMQCYDAHANRTVSQIEVSAQEAANGVRPEIYVPMSVRVDSRGNIILLEPGFATIRRLNPVTGEAKLLDGALEDRFSRWQTGWMWLDVDRWGNSGPKDGIYWSMTTSGGVVSGEDVGDRHINELFAWLPADGGVSKWVTGPDWEANPDGWGSRYNTDIPHYPWNVAIDPRGAIYITGIGEFGITRLRVRKPTDPMPSDYIKYYEGKKLWASGDATGGHSMALKFGWAAHNYLGFADAWGAAGKSDAELIQMFEIPDSIQNDPVQRSTILNFIRLNAGDTTSNGGPPRPPTNVRLIK